MLEEVVHGRPGRDDVHGRRRVGDEPAHAAVDVGDVVGRHVQGVVDPAERPQGRLPPRRESLHRLRLAGQPVRGGIQVIRVADLAGETATTVLLLIDVLQEWPGVGRPGNDADLEQPAEILMLVHGCPSREFVRLYPSPLRGAPARVLPRRRARSHTGR
jgi:hypothetical protein